MALTERILTVYNDKGSKQAVKDLKSLEKKFGEAGKKIAKAFAVATAAAGALAIKIGKDAVAAAMADEKSQTLLANALRNTVGATDEAIASSEEFITSLQMQLGIADDQLRPALASLATATGDLGQAQTLLGLALDASAGSGQSLDAVTRALGRAVNGNLTSLGKMFPALDKNAIASGDLVAVTQQLATLYGGAAEDNANTFAGQMDRLRIAFGEILESIGYRFIPVLQNLVRIINEQVIPAVQKWLDENGQRLANVFENIISYVVAFSKSMFDAFSFVARNAKVFTQIGAIIIATFAGAKVAMAVTAFVKGIQAIIKVMKLLRTASLASAAATALATGGASAVAGAAAFSAALIGVNLAVNKLNKDADKTSENLDFKFDSLKVSANDYTKGLGKLTMNQQKSTKASKAAKVAVEAELKAKQALAALAKMGVVPTNGKDPIQLEAARLNLIRQNNIAEANRLKAVMDAMEAQMKLNEAAQRYADLLQVLADSKISDQEVSVLAQKWNVTKGEVLEYIARIYAANSTELNDGAVIQLLMAWGLTRREAERYVDFTRALKDEKLDDSEIEKLMGKWKMTRAEVIAYGKQVQAGTAFSTTWDDPGKLAEQSWLDALSALNAYLTALKSQTPAQPVPIVPSEKPKITPVTPVTPVIPGGVAMTPVSSAAILDDVRMYVEAFSNALANPQLNFVDVGGGVLETRTMTGGGIPSFLDYLDATPESRGFGGRLPFGTTREAINVTVNVAGNVTSEADLTSAIRDNILQGQKQGEAISYNVFAI